MGLNTVCHRVCRLSKPVAALRHVSRSGLKSLMIPKNAGGNAKSMRTLKLDHFSKRVKTKLSSTAYQEKTLQFMNRSFFRSNQMLGLIPTAYRNKTLQLIASSTLFTFWSYGRSNRDLIISQLSTRIDSSQNCYYYFTLLTYFANGIVAQAIFRSHSKRPCKREPKWKAINLLGFYKGQRIESFSNSNDILFVQPTNSYQLPLAGLIPTSTTTTTFSQPPEFIFYNEYTLHRVIFVWLLLNISQRYNGISLYNL